MTRIASKLRRSYGQVPLQVRRNLQIAKYFFMKIKAFDCPAVGGTFPIKKLSYKNNSLKKIKELLQTSLFLNEFYSLIKSLNLKFSTASNSSVISFEGAFVKRLTATIVTKLRTKPGKSS